MNYGFNLPSKEGEIMIYIILFFTFYILIIFDIINYINKKNK